MQRGWRFCRVISIGIVLGLAFAGLLITPFGSAERTEPGVMGTVTDGTGTPLEGVEVRVVKLDRSWGNGSYTNSTGEYIVNITDPGSYLAAFVMDGYFERAQVFQVSGIDVITIDASLTSMPAETEDVFGILVDSGHVAKMGYEVRLLYEEGNDRHEYSAATTGEGRFSWTVFPGDYTFEVYDQELAVYSEDITISLGDGPVELFPVLPDLPPKDVRIMGYVTDGTDPIEEAMVGVMDSNNDIFNVTYSNETGYFELGFWAGFHYIVSFTDGFEGYFRGLQIGGGESIWVNVTLMEEEYQITGVINGPDGEPIEGVSVQYLQRYVFPETNSATTDSDGEFTIDIAGGDGFLMVVDDNPFETGEFDVYFEKHTGVSDDFDVTIDLTDGDINQGEAHITFDNWTNFSTNTRMRLPINNSMAGRAMVDLMIGDGDLMISQFEFEQWEEAMMGDDSDMSDGPFGNNTEGNLTLNGMNFMMDDGSMETQFVNFTGPVDSSSPLELQQSGAYTLLGEEPEGVMREISFNGTYNEGNEDMALILNIPENWRPTSVTETIHQVYLFVDHVIMKTADDPNPDDDIDFEWATLTFYDDTFDVIMDPIEPVNEGEEVMIELNITDNLPENEYNITWSLDGTVVENEKMMNLTLVFTDDGSYEVQADIVDDFDRSIQYVMPVVVENLAPTVTLEIIGEENQTFIEGGVIELKANASDMGVDDLFIEWGEMGTFSESLNYTDDNRTMYFDIKDDGVMTYQVRITDDDNFSVIVEVTINVSNGAPTFDWEIFEEGEPGDHIVTQGEIVTIDLLNIMDPGSEDEITLDWSVPDTGLSTVYSNNNESLSIIFIETGSVSIFINISDGDGGFTIHEFNFEVEENFTFDQDRDGLPKWWEDDKGLSDTFPDDALMDPDMDNLTNLQEYDMGTEPMESDSDSDGVPDNWDGFPIDASKYDKDSDEDGVFDWDEIIGGTDPLDPEDYPEKKSGKDDNGWVIYLVLLIIGVLLIAGIMALMISRSKQQGLEYEE